MGGYTIFIVNIMGSPYQIRWEAEITRSIGTQISYIGWIAIALTMLWIHQKKITRWWMIPVLFQFTGNLFFIDRTRPIWILFTTILILFSIAQHITTAKIIKIAIATLAGAGVVFIALAIWIGKEVEQGSFGNTILPPNLQGIYVYGTSGFAYFDHIIKVEHNFYYTPDRIIYPLMQVTSKIGLTNPPPSQIIDFYEVPFSTNVGTFLEPFYRDGGLVLSIFGMMIYSFVFDGLALWYLNQRNIFADYAWTNICFASFICFFTPKMASVPLWLFCGLGLAMSFLLPRARRPGC
jgi:oligosaccharide repeat unit polymerase